MAQGRRLFPFVILPPAGAQSRILLDPNFSLLHFHSHAVVRLHIWAYFQALSATAIADLLEYPEPEQGCRHACSG